MVTHVETRKRYPGSRSVAGEQSVGLAASRHRAQHEARIDRHHPRQPPEMLAVKSFIIIEILREDLEPVVLPARHQCAFDDPVDLRHRALEPRQILLDLRAKRDVDERGDTEAEPPMSQSGTVTGDMPR